MKRGTLATAMRSSEGSAMQKLGDAKRVKMGGNEGESGHHTWSRMQRLEKGAETGTAHGQQRQRAKRRSGGKDRTCGTTVHNSSPHGKEVVGGVRGTEGRRLGQPLSAAFRAGQEDAWRLAPRGKEALSMCNNGSKPQAPLLAASPRRAETPSGTQHTAHRRQRKRAAAAVRTGRSRRQHPLFRLPRVLLTNATTPSHSRPEPMADGSIAVLRLPAPAGAIGRKHLLVPGAIPD